MNLKARRVEERWNFRVQSYLWLLWVPDFWSFLSYERSEDRVICDNGLREKYYLLDFLLLFLLKNCLQLQASNIIHVVDVDEMNLS